MTKRYKKESKTQVQKQKIYDLCFGTTQFYPYLLNSVQIKNTLSANQSSCKIKILQQPMDWLNPSSPTPYLLSGMAPSTQEGSSSKTRRVCLSGAKAWVPVALSLCWLQKRVPPLGTQLLSQVLSPQHPFVPTLSTQQPDTAGLSNPHCLCPPKSSSVPCSLIVIPIHKPQRTTTVSRHHLGTCGSNHSRAQGTFNFPHGALFHA